MKKRLRWGYIDSTSHASPDKMQWLKVKTITLDECREKMSKQNADRIYGSNICAITEDTTGGGKDCTFLKLIVPFNFKIQTFFILACMGGKKVLINLHKKLKFIFLINFCCC